MLARVRRYRLAVAILLTKFCIDYASFAEAVLSATLRRLRLRMLPPPQALTTSLALLDLLRLRMDQMRAHSSEEVTINAPFEAFVACHVSLGSSLASIGACLTRLTCPS